MKTLTLLLPLFLLSPAVAAEAVSLLSAEQASNFAKLALRCVQKEYPNKLDHVMNDASEVRNPQDLHPAFYGCFDWHSSVHGHWMLVRLLKLYPGLPEAPAIRSALNANLNSTAIAAEVAYLGQANRQSFERTYGWAWLLKLAEELAGWEDPDARRWAVAVNPLATALATRLAAFLPRQNYPIRTGVHPNTAFALAFALDYARKAADKPLEALLIERSRTYFGADADYPAAWEPGGEDFFSPALVEADLMRRVMRQNEFGAWLGRFLPGLERGEPHRLLQPAVVTDRTDPKLVHLDGLNLSRAWCMRSIAATLAPTDPRRNVLLDSAERHGKASLPFIASGDYAGEHWLASFAVHLLSTEAPR
jgi:hypothetical protein